MDRTVRNLDKEAYRELRARAVLEGRTVGDLISEAFQERGSLRSLEPEEFPDGNERLSSDIDLFVYGQP